MKQIKPILSMIIALLYFILGFIIIFSQSNLILNVIDIITILFLTTGAIQLYTHFYFKEKDQFNLVNGTISLWIGIIVLNHYDILNLPVLISIYSASLSIIFIKKYLKNKTNINSITSIGLIITTILLTFKSFSLVAAPIAGLLLIIISFYQIIEIFLIPTKPKKRNAK